MIKIIKGVYGYRNKNGIIEPKTTESTAFSLTDAQEERLVKIGVAAYADEEGVAVAPVQQPLEDHIENAKKEILERMNFNDLKKLAKEKGITTMAIVNVVGSSIAREADKVFYTLAGPEISVATTKAYSAQLAAMYCLAVQFAKVRGKITDEQYSYYISELQTIPEKIQKTLLLH